MLNYYFYLQIYYSIQHLKRISLFVILLRAFRGCYEGPTYAFFSSILMKPSSGSAKPLQKKQPLEVFCKIRCS